ncbi:16S rRNA (cytosine(1402)-N(4))-methyltransferase RsmH [Acetobacterium woodii]|uniref:Ribosomal RNA small subunit methyltransferase H n=1 Tax=Acetobacterium woodii (strain ATCC 29683 / DSM 1030 / JCM 2381 / KCTC 1655 / WB1) TaxID=931626 RepID=H6LCG2_ACEWD|nr:16S rRNA (cytosine(1402)-N(4))-methyltransferase RsmH [Acetobacterium woodii]AFA47744.1 S-adenosyl-L-methionine-dependent methyltransferase MraW1 [Acetobacterium woodii DSM 1030]
MKPETFSHTTVLLRESIDGLDIKPDGSYVDCTLGGGGHSQWICEALNENGVLVGIDQDDYALRYAKNRLEPYACQRYFVKSNFASLTKVLEGLHLSGIDGILYDLGVSSFQLDDDTRGFSYHNDGPLDMRMNQVADLTAEMVVNDYAPGELKKILFLYGEEKFASQIVKSIVKAREIKRIQTTLELSEIIKHAYPPKERFKEKHPSRKTFQAIRLEVNGELKILEDALIQGIAALKPGGRMCVITFHSLEDRVVKRLFKERANPCTCPPDFPQCVCGKKPEVKLISRKPISSGIDELEKNRRSRSAKLRIVEKLETES